MIDVVSVDLPCDLLLADVVDLPMDGLLGDCWCDLLVHVEMFRMILSSCQDRCRINLPRLLVVQPCVVMLRLCAGRPGPAF